LLAASAEKVGLFLLYQTKMTLIKRLLGAKIARRIKENMVYVQWWTQFFLKKRKRYLEVLEEIKNHVHTYYLDTYSLNLK
jgi:hypothetical protein